MEGGASAGYLGGRGDENGSDREVGNCFGEELKKKTEDGPIVWSNHCY